MKKVCAWCGAVVSAGTGARPVTHGICQQCKEAALIHLTPRSLATFLEKLRMPVLAVDAGNRVLAANHLACEHLGKRADEVVGRLCGDLLDCLRASLPGGCSKTQECPTCTVRRALEHTYSSGETCRRLLVSVDARSPGATTRTELVITTEKAGAVVLLRVDEIRREVSRTSPESTG
jgi:PAS domain-containing protein